MKKLIINTILIISLIINILSLDVFADTIGTDMEGHWAKEYAQRLIDNGILNGYEDGTVKLDNSVSRAEFVKMLVTFRYGDYHTYEEQIFADVPTDAWYYKYVSTAHTENILEEKKGEEFRPNENITRGEMVYMIVSSLNLSGGKASFSDIKSSHKYYKHISAAVKNGIINGYEDGTFKEEGFATRGETSAMVSRILDYITYKELNGEPDSSVDVIEPVPDTDNNTGIEGKINLTWHQIYGTGVTKTGSHMDGLNVISPTWFKLVDNTGLTPYSYEQKIYGELNLYLEDLGNLEYIEDCKANGYKVWPMFNTEGSPSKTSKFLNSLSAREACVQMMKKLILEYDLDGINLDFENMYQSDRDAYTEFVKEMADMCHSVGAILSVDVTRYEPTSSTYSMCYDRKAIAKYADYVALMAYDQNGTWSTTAGSVADLEWTEDSIIKTLEEVPAEKLILGIPFYARIWETSNGKVVKTSAVGMSTVAKRIEENNAQIVYDEKTGQNYAEWISEGNVVKVWIEDKTSVKARLDLVEKYNLVGIASWSKTFETEDMWEYIEENLK